MSKLPSLNQLPTKDPSAGGTIATISPGRFSATPDRGEVWGAIGAEAKRVSAQAIKIQDDMNKTSIQDAINQYNTERSALELKRMAVKGKNAANKQFVDESVLALDSISNKVKSGLKNSAQTKMWDNLYGQDKVKFGSGMAKHSLNQHDIWDKQVVETGVINGNDKAKLNWQNPAEIDGTVLDSESLIADYYTKQGEDESTIGLRINKMKSGRYVDVINTAISVDDKNSPEYLNTASDLLKRYGNSIPSAELNKFNKIINTEREVKQVVDEASAFISGNPEAKDTEIKAHAKKLYPNRVDLQKAAKIEMKAYKVAISNDQAVFRDEQNDTVASTFVDGTVTRESILRTVGDDQDQLKWLGRYNNMRTKGDGYIEDDVVRAKLRTMANTDAKNLTNDMIWETVYATKGITDQTAQAIMIRRDTVLGGSGKAGSGVKSKNLKAGHDLIKAYKKVGHPINKDVEMNETDFALFHRGLDDAYEAAEDADEVFDAIKWTEEQYIVPAKEGWVWKFLKDSFVGTGGSAVPSAIGYVAGAGKVTDQSAIDFLRSNGKVVNDKTIAAANEYLESR